jgi:FG-GAP repeat
MFAGHADATIVDQPHTGNIPMLSTPFRPAILLALLIGMLPAIEAHAVSDAWTQDNSLMAMTPTVGAGFGAAIATEGDVMVIGQPRATVNNLTQAGSAEVWRRQASGWTRETTLVEFSPKASAHFGVTVAVQGDTIYVAAPNRQNNTVADAGTITIFVRNTSSGVWQYVQENYGVCADEHSGAAVAVQRDMFAQGHPGSCVFVGGFVQIQYGIPPALTADYATLQETNGTAGDNFGASIAIYRSPDPAQPDLAVIGAPNQDLGFAGPSNGAVYVFANATHVGSGWQAVAYLHSQSSAPNEFFGRSVAVAPGYVIVGAPGRNKTTGTPVTAAGSVFVFVPDGSGGWTQQSEIFLSPAASGDGFGATVAYDAVTGRIFAGAPARTTNLFGGSGPTGIVAVFRFKKIINFIFDWVDTAELESLDLPSISQSAGSAIAVSQGTAFIGAPDYDGAGASANSGRVLTFTADEIFANGFD